MEAGTRDSIVIFISKIQSINDENDIVPIDDAKIILTKNGVPKNEITNKKNGKYILREAPLPGATYKIMVKVDGYKTLEAETTVPEIPEARAWFKKDSIPDDTWAKGYRVQKSLKIELTDKPGNDYYWFVSALIRQQKLPYGSFGIFYRTNNLLFDSFNRYATQDNIEPFTNFEYCGALRLTDENLATNIFTFSMSASNNTTLFIINADEHFDRYYKSSIKQFLMYEYDNLPIFEPVQIYSNVKNGFGIFGSIAVTSFYFGDKHN